MVEAIVKDMKKVLPCAAFLQGDTGVKDLFMACQSNWETAG